MTRQQVYPFSAIVGQEDLKLGLLLNVIAPSIGGVLIMGHRGTGKSTAVRALAELLPPLSKVRDCFYGCDPLDEANYCSDCAARLAGTRKLAKARAPVPIVELPLNATEDRVCGSINLERAIKEGVKTFEPGLLARAHRGFLYIDEVNLLEDHLVDLLLDVAATGRNRVEREGISIEHPARFVLAGSGNPEEGELRPQLLDRFGLYTEICTVADLDERVEIITRREAFDHDPALFCARWAQSQTQLRRRLMRAQRDFKHVHLAPEIVRAIAELCLRLKVDGHRGELTIARASRALAAFENRKEVAMADVRRVARMALSHRLRRDPLEQQATTGGGSQIEQATEELFAAATNSGEAAQAATANEAGSHRPAKNPPDEPDGNGDGGEGAKYGARRTDEERAPNSRGEQRPAPPPLDARLPIDSFDEQSRMKKPQAKSAGRAKHLSNATASATRGRYSRAVAHRTENAKIALDASVRAAASARMFRRRPASGHALRVEASDFRYKRFTRRAGMLFIFAVDTSGSMALNRIAQAKGALARLLRQSYINRDRVALITFREREAQVLLTPARSTALAKRLLDALPIGGATPLTAGLLRALEISERAARQDAPRIVLLVFTDGRANVPLDGIIEGDRTKVRGRIKFEVEKIGVALQRLNVEAVIVDTQNRFTSGGEGQALAHALGGRYVHLPSQR
ncbi:MAG: magnesium chelatase ATPase subunit I [Pyrinomonadaceae bacterium]